MANLEIKENSVVEISDAFFQKDNGLFVVEKSYTYNDGSQSFYLTKLNKKNMAKTKTTTSWPLCAYLNDPVKNRQANRHNEQYAKIKFLCPYVEPEKKPVSNEVKILKHGIKKGENYCPCYFWKNSNETITISSRHYNTHIPREIGDVHNDSDSMTDYFETDSCTITSENPYYKIILKKVFGE